jgi:3-deoxy-D-manno-octulosonate 8-phosphate phosphatase (KDO 8-P phosphatase)
MKKFFLWLKSIVLKKRLVAISIIVCDVDGVLTDGTIGYSESHHQMRCFHVHDGLAVKLLQDSGYKFAFISGGRGSSILRRADDLGVDYVYAAVNNKLHVLRELIAELKCEPCQILYVGDDLNDLAVKDSVGLFVSPPNAVSDVRHSSDLVLSVRGGRGCLRELAHILLQSHDSHTISELYANRNLPQSK